MERSLVGERPRHASRSWIPVTSSCGHFWVSNNGAHRADCLLVHGDLHPIPFDSLRPKEASASQFTNLLNIGWSRAYVYVTAIIKTTC